VRQCQTDFLRKITTTAGQTDLGDRLLSASAEICTRLPEQKAQMARVSADATTSVLVQTRLRTLPPHMAPWRSTRGCAVTLFFRAPVATCAGITRLRSQGQGRGALVSTPPVCDFGGRAPFPPIDSTRHAAFGLSEDCASCDAIISLPISRLLRSRRKKRWWRAKSRS
jgi:hypothetical protein